MHGNDRSDELAEEMRAALAEIREKQALLERQLAEIDADQAADPVSRRDWLRKAAIGAAGAIGGAVVMASPAAADDPNDITLGATKATTGFTQVNYTGKSRFRRRVPVTISSRTPRASASPSSTADRASA